MRRTQAENYANKARGMAMLAEGMKPRHVAQACGVQPDTARDWNKERLAKARRAEARRERELETLRRLEAEMASAGAPDCAGAAQKAGAVEVGLPAPPAPADPMIASLMARGLSRQAAVQSAALYRSRRAHGRHHARPAP